jgi:hypothetical protein
MTKPAKSKVDHLIIFRFRQTPESAIQEWHENTNGRLIIITKQEIENQLKGLYPECVFEGWVIR